MVNNNFYGVINSLISQATAGGLTATSYDTFIDAGKAINANINFQNGFLNALMNKLALSIDTYRAYTGKYKELDKGTLGAGNTVEMVMGTFYNTQAAAFGASLTNGASVDQYVVQKPDFVARYFVDTNTFSIGKTIERTELLKAFESPEAMDTFIRNITGYMLNSVERARELGRVGLVAGAIIDGIWKATDDSSAAVTTNENSIYYKLGTAYATETGNAAPTTVAEALNDKDFVLYAVASIKKIRDRMTDPTNKFSESGAAITFTPEENSHLFISSALETAMDTYIYNNNYRPDRSMLRDYIPVLYWQSEDNPFSVDGTGNTSTTAVTNDNVIAFVCDDWALRCYNRLQSMETTPYNARGRYWNVFANNEVMYIDNKDANRVVFTID